MKIFQAQNLALTEEQKYVTFHYYGSDKYT